jgi:hypothetical protein
LVNSQAINKNRSKAERSPSAPNSGTLPHQLPGQLMVQAIPQAIYFQ